MLLTAFGLTFAFISFFCAGFSLAHYWHQKDRRDFQKDCFYCHECILCKPDKDAAYCRSKDKACIKCIARVMPASKPKKRKPGYMGDVNGAGSDPDTV